MTTMATNDTTTSSTITEGPRGWAPSVPTPEDPLKWGDNFPTAAARTLRNTQMRRNLGHATRTIRDKRAMRVAEMPDWEQLRLAGSAIKNRAMSHLPELLEQMEANVIARGGHVHWASTGEEACRIAHSIAALKGATEVVKVKSMVSQEIGLNEYFAERGINAWETDLAEMIVQLSEDMPSHIVVPAIHRNRSEVRAIFKARMEDAPEDLSDEPPVLTAAARAHLRKKFLSAKVAISGANMMIAESGTLVVVESEGNGRMCLTVPETLVSIVGIEKIVPTYQDFEVIAQLLPRSATGERMNPYTSLWTGVTPGDGPQEFHLILLDNGRSKVLADPIGRQALHCIRCGSCMNVCPVYEHVGGHAYQSVYPGPIGAILTPQLRGAFDHHDPAASLPFASSLCNACFDACPMRINIPDVLVELRHRAVEAQRGGIPSFWDVAMKAASVPMSKGSRMGMAGKVLPLARVMAGPGQRFVNLPWPATAWSATRDVPAPPGQTFRAWMAERDKTGSAPSGRGASGRGGACGCCGQGGK
ncbi:iron-sulfur cluster-binding protein [Schaalia sp. 19OD2882]|uniref:LutB/LldF family L-lactate oxidation iron-sulfur protein n=1 Tax=Schaalia sp. 19OD2882 TaxID=2794089 RepID=UPI001C1F018D|nr:LutB/LldF family L-lactate oxidation iron-sulfur protein [Schaalia sp. 19OD2882]QWW19922.1 iron-sulfur cluster-binding protein [Schaalia sp. 19OD2882]